MSKNYLISVFAGAVVVVMILGIIAAAKNDQANVTPTLSPTMDKVSTIISSNTPTAVVASTLSVVSMSSTPTDPLSPTNTPTHTQTPASTLT